MAALADDQRANDLTEPLAYTLFIGEERHIVNRIRGSGLDHASSEEAFDRLRRNVAACVIDAIRQYSALHTLDFPDQLDKLEAGIESDSVEDYLDSFEEDDMLPIVEDCIYAAFREAGLEL